MNCLCSSFDIRPKRCKDRELQELEESRCLITPRFLSEASQQMVMILVNRLTCVLLIMSLCETMLQLLSLIKWVKKENCSSLMEVWRIEARGNMKYKIWHQQVNKVIANTYIKVLGLVVKFWIKSLAQGRLHLLQQNCSLLHGPMIMLAPCGLLTIMLAPCGLTLLILIPLGY